VSATPVAEHRSRREARTGRTEGGERTWLPSRRAGLASTCSCEFTTAAAAAWSGREPTPQKYENCRFHGASGAQAGGLDVTALWTSLR
jgi:hypothetical protein